MKFQTVCIGETREVSTSLRKSQLKTYGVVTIKERHPIWDIPSEAIPPYLREIDF